MPPNNSNDSAFVFDTRAWASLSTVAMQRQQIEMDRIARKAASYYVPHPNHKRANDSEGGWDTTKSSSSGGPSSAGEKDARESAVATSALTGGVGDDGDRPMHRSRSSPSLATLLRRNNPRKKSSSKSLPRDNMPDQETDNMNPSRRGATGKVARSQSFVAPKDGNASGVRSKSAGRNRRREISGISRSFVAPKNDNASVARSKSAGRNRRREISGIMEQQQQQQQQQQQKPMMKCCEVHPQVRLRSGRCPRCAAAETKKGMGVRRKSLGRIAPTTVAPSAPDDAGCASCDESRRSTEARGGMPVCQGVSEEFYRGSDHEDDCHDAADVSTDRAAAADTSLMEEVDIEEVSLDPKWAEALRGISLRLANEKAHQTIEDLAVEGCDSDSEEHLPTEQQPCRSPKTLDELLQATESMFNTFMEEGDYDNDDNISHSSIAMNTPVVKTFAESKTQLAAPQLEQQQSVGSSRCQNARHATPNLRRLDDPLTMGLEFIATAPHEKCRSSNGGGSCRSSVDSLTMGLEFIGTAPDTKCRSSNGGDGSCRSSGSDESSVTCSITSGYTMGSFNSFAAAPPPPQAIMDPFTSPLGPTLLGPARSNETYDSPNSVVDAMNLYPETRSCYSDYEKEGGEMVQGEEEEEEEEQRDFENSFFMSIPKDYSEKKMTAPLTMTNEVVANGNTTNNDTMNHLCRPPTFMQAVDDSSSPTDNSQREDSSAMIQDQHHPHKNVQQAVLVEDVTSESDEGEPASVAAPPHEARSTRREDPSSAAVAGDKKTMQQQRRSSSKKENRRPGSKIEREASVEDLSDGEPNDVPPVRSQSFFSALVHNSRSRSRSRPRQAHVRSKSRSRKDVGASATEAATKPVVKARKSKMDKKLGKRGVDHFAPKSSMTVTEEEKPQVDEEAKPNQSVSIPPEPKVESRPEVVAKVLPEEESPPPLTTTTAQDGSHAPQPSPEEAHDKCYLPMTSARSPITHPLYKLGDLARDQDMIIFPKISRSRGKRRRHRSRRRRGRSQEEDSSSDSSDEDDDEYEERSGRSRKYFSEADLWSAVGQLRHLDAAFVRRSDGRWTYALVADGNSDEIRFVVNGRGSTKSFPKSTWKSSVRRIRVLTQRAGDRMAINTKTRGHKRSISRSRSFRGGGGRRGGSKGGRRLVSPSPTRRNSGVLNLPPTIFEGERHN